MPKTSTFVVDHAFQREWGIKGRNLLIMFAFYFGGMGAGLYMIALLGNYLLGALLGVIIGGIGKGLCHIFFLGQPLRFWRAVWRPQASWISRGFIFFSVFMLSGFAYLLPEYSMFAWLPWKAQDTFGIFLYWVSVISAFLTIIYTGLLLNRTAIPFWHHSLLPVLFLAISLFSGADLANLFYHTLPQPEVNISIINQSALWCGMGVLCLLFFYFWSAFNVNVASQKSVRFLALNTETAWYFYGLFLVLGLIFPIMVSIIDAFNGGIGAGLFIFADVVEIIMGALLFRYILLRGGVFMAPII